MDSLFCNLKVISQLNEMQKLRVNGDYLVIDNNNLLSPIYRILYYEDREKTLKRIHDIVDESIQNGNQAIRSESGSDFNYLENSKTNIELRKWELERDRVTSTDNLGFLERLIIEMQGMVNGINNLKKTYENDITLCSKLEIEIQNINTNIEKFRRFLSVKE